MTIQVQNVTKRFGSFEALNGVNLDIQPGELVALLGPSGSGKTTLLRVISGMLKPKAGTARFGDADLAALPAHALPGIGIAHVPENRRLFPHLSVEENLKVGAYIPSARKRFAERLDYVFGMFPRLKERRRQLAGTMSGGEQQMCAIGRALMCSPRILLLDEPSAGLAPLVVAQVFALVQRIRAEGLTVLIVEQNVAQVLRVVDRAYVLEAGRVVAEGTSAQLASDPMIRSAFLGGH